MQQMKNAEPQSLLTNRSQLLSPLASLLSNGISDEDEKKYNMHNIRLLSHENTNVNKHNLHSLSSQSVSIQVSEMIEALALCHNVTPVVSFEDDNHSRIVSIDYQASSPDEIALVKFSEKVGVSLINRTHDRMTLRIQMQTEMIEFDDNDDGLFVDVNYEILNVFPFTSEV